MMGLGEIVILGAARTPIGRYGGSLKDIHPAELGAVAARAALERAGVPATVVEEVVFGHGRQAGSGPNPARQVAHRAGLPHTVPAQTINKACASGLQAIVSAAQSLLLGEAAVAIAGGIESMSRMPYLVDAADARWGHKMGHFPFVDAMYRDGFADPLSGLIMGETAEVLARQYGITREESDAFALGSQRKAEAAQREGRFDAEIAAVEVTSRGTTTRLSADEHPRPGSTLEGLAKLPLTFPVVEGQAGIITAGSASGITDGGAAVVLATAEWARAQGIAPLARLTGWASAGVDPRIMGIGPVPALHTLKARTGLTIDDVDLVELNEAFAAQVIAVTREVPIPEEKLNVNGGAIALGHPIGCTGTRMVVTLLHELRRRGKARGIATLCVSGGMGMAMGIEVLA
ncbi:MAG: acetyl-CoA C-acyltransferase [Vicinamibacterales bacterium]